MAARTGPEWGQQHAASTSRQQTQVRTADRSLAAGAVPGGKPELI